MNNQGFSIASLVCGILGIIGSFIPVVRYFTLILAILGVVFGVKARKIEKNGMATAGLVCGIVSLAFTAIGLICALCAIGMVGAMA